MCVCVLCVHVCAYTCMHVCYCIHILLFAEIIGDVGPTLRGQYRADGRSFLLECDIGEFRDGVDSILVELTKNGVLVTSQILFPKQTTVTFDVESIGIILGAEVIIEVLF